MQLEHVTEENRAQRCVGRARRVLAKVVRLAHGRAPQEDAQLKRLADGNHRHFVAPHFVFRHLVAVDVVVEVLCQLDPLFK